jgi:hypothetical protein
MKQRPKDTFISMIFYSVWEMRFANTPKSATNPSKQSYPFSVRSTAELFKELSSVAYIVEKFEDNNKELERLKDMVACMEDVMAVAVVVSFEQLTALVKDPGVLPLKGVIEPNDPYGSESDSRMLNYLSVFVR